MDGLLETKLAVIAGMNLPVDGGLTAARDKGG